MVLLSISGSFLNQEVASLMMMITKVQNQSKISWMLHQIPFKNKILKIMWNSWNQGHQYMKNIKKKTQP